MKERIRQLMEAQHMNQQAFARFTNIGVASLSSIFTGRTKPTMNHLVAIMDAFPNVNPIWLIKGEGMMMLSNDQSANAPIDTSAVGTTKSGSGETSALLDIVTDSTHGVVHEFTPYDSGQAIGTRSNTAGPAGKKQGSLFDEDSFYNENSNNQAVSSTNTKRRVESTSAYQPQISSVSGRRPTNDRMADVKFVTSPAPQRKITEIRVFYDDQTWESFVPKK